MLPPKSTLKQRAADQTDAAQETGAADTLKAGKAAARESSSSSSEGKQSRTKERLYGRGERRQRVDLGLRRLRLHKRPKVAAAPADFTDPDAPVSEADLKKRAARLAEHDSPELHDSTSSSSYSSEEPQPLPQLTFREVVRHLRKLAWLKTKQLFAKSSAKVAVHDEAWETGSAFNSEEKEMERLDADWLERLGDAFLYRDMPRLARRVSFSLFEYSTLESTRARARVLSRVVLEPRTLSIYTSHEVSSDSSHLRALTKHLV